ncbi:thiamine biosynthesis protein ApbE, partial [Bordetella pertussis]
DISRFNRAATGWQALPEALFHVLSHALDLADASRPRRPSRRRWTRSWPR